MCTGYGVPSHNAGEVSRELITKGLLMFGSLYLKDTGEAHLKSGYSVISFDFNVENKCGLWGRSWEFFVVIQVRNDGGLNVMIVRKDTGTYV